jgi:gamma-glutamyltranspeptidase/glutathione hydrolase
MTGTAHLPMLGHCAMALAFALVFVGAPGAQAPGDRPATNPRSTRSVVLARNGLVATSQPLASAAGLQVLQEGGNAIDAAVTAAAVLAVVEPTMTGIGGDLFALVWDAKTRSLHALNASGRSGHAATAQVFNDRGLKEVPSGGPLSVTVPGVVDGWSELLSKYGTVDLHRALAPAIRYAQEGYPVSEIIAVDWESAADDLAADPAAAATFLPDGRAPSPGQVFRNPNLARTLGQIAADGRDAFYRGPIAKVIADDLQKRHGLLDLEDFTSHHSDWVDPLSTNYRGYDVYELPPNTQGLVALEMLNILEGYDLKAMGAGSPDYLHVLIEAKRIAYADRDAYIADPGSVPAGLVQMLLSKEYAATRRKEINLKKAAGSFAPGPWARTPTQASVDIERLSTGDTIYMTAADGQGNVVSLIQSLFSTFGACIVAGDTGIALHNRGSMFTLEPGHPDQIAPRKRPLHTLVPAMVLKDGKPWLSYGVMGGDMQPQGHVQVLANLVDFGMNIQEAGEAPRVRHMSSGVALENAISAEARFELDLRGHKLINSIGVFGGFQGILIDPRSGVLMGGSDPRKDGLAIGY